jgi:hypothetical protein
MLGRDDTSLPRRGAKRFRNASATSSPTPQAEATAPLPPASIVELRSIGSARARIEVIEFSDYQ